MFPIDIYRTATEGADQVGRVEVATKESNIGNLCTNTGLIRNSYERYVTRLAMCNTGCEQEEVSKSEASPGTYRQHHLLALTTDDDVRC